MDERLFYLPSCSCMTLQSESGRHYWFRTCDTENDLWADGAHCAAFLPGDTLKLEAGSSVKVEYGFMGLTYNHRSSWILDGINEAGLTGGLLMLREGTSRARPEEGEGCVGMELIGRLLAVCKDVEAVKEKALKLEILDVPNKDSRVPAAMHFFFADAGGREVVLEAADPSRPGRLCCYEKEEGIGVMTNSPIYPRQMENCRRFLAKAESVRKGGRGDWKMPGGYSSIDRFLRLALLKTVNDNGSRFSDEEILAQGSILMGSVVEPYHGGILHYEEGDESGKEANRKESCTRYLVMYDLTERRMYLRKRNEANWSCLRLVDAFLDKNTGF